MIGLKEYELKLGMFWINFNSLELLLRVYLVRARGESEEGLEAREGEICPLSHLTNYDSFTTLVKKYNELMLTENQIEVSEVSRLRDAIAHGRVTTKDQIPMTVVKYTRHRNGQVKVATRQTLTMAYLDEQIRITNRLVLVVTERIKEDYPR